MPHISELTKNIVVNSGKIKELAYSPYSKFKVGASILTSTNNIYSGCNIESCSYGATICAESSAIAQMISSGDTLISEIAISCSKNKTCYPCGLCLQRMLEFSNKNTKIHLCINNKIIETLNITELLPYAFNRCLIENEV